MEKSPIMDALLGLSLSSLIIAHARQLVSYRFAFPYPINVCEDEDAMTVTSLQSIDQTVF